MEEGILNKLEKYFSKEENELFLGRPVDNKVIEKAEKELNVKFDDNYKEFISKFGGSYIGFPIYAFNNCDMLSEDTVVDLTNDFRTSYSFDKKYDIINKSYVISMDGNGDPIIINPKGEVLIYYHDNDIQEILSNSFKELIETYLPN